MSFTLMQFSLKYIILLIFLSYSRILHALGINANYESVWTGIEVIGTDSATAQKIRELNLVKIGNTFPASKAKYYCDRCKKLINKKMKLAQSHCSILWYGDSIAYLIIETAAENSNTKLFRTIPKSKNAVLKVPKELNTVFIKWDTQMTTLMSSGNFSMEKLNDNFRDFSDPMLHNLAVQLSQLVPKYNHDLLEIVHYSPYVEERQKAAQLFAWSNHAENLPYLLELNLLLDPDEEVRNNIARSFSQFMSKIKDEALLKDLIPAYCIQAALPSHTDRNKALISINRMLDAHPKLVTTITPECKKNITYISNTSILNNVKGPATDILKIIEAAEHA